MTRFRKQSLFTGAILCAVLTAVYAAPLTDSAGSIHRQNLYQFYTAKLTVDDSGVVKVPSRYQWSVETTWLSTDAKGNKLPDSGVLLRLYDPDHNFTALTAQMDLDTAEKLQGELAEIIEKKRRDPDFEFRPQLYDPKDIPVGELKGINKDGQAIIELRKSDGSTETIPNQKAAKRNVTSPKSSDSPIKD